MRQTLLSTRFNTACFGVLGYELDLKYLNRLEKKEVIEQIEFYKKHRRLLQYGKFSRVRSDKDNQLFWQCTAEGDTWEKAELLDGFASDDDILKATHDDAVAVTGFYQGVAETADGHSTLRVIGLDYNKTYETKTKPQRIFIERFGGLVKHILPISLNPEGIILRTANKYHTMWDSVEEYKGDGKLLSQGIMLNNQFMGSYYNEETELLGDFGSYLFVTKEAEDK
jgi:alpha-galactosidase